MTPSRNGMQRREDTMISINTEISADNSQLTNPSAFSSSSTSLSYLEKTDSQQAFVRELAEFNRSPEYPTHSLVVEDRWVPDKRKKYCKDRGDFFTYTDKRRYRRVCKHPGCNYRSIYYCSKCTDVDEEDGRYFICERHIYDHNQMVKERYNRQKDGGHRISIIRK